MAEPTELKLEEISFRGAPTESQMGNALHDIQVFLNKATGAMLHEGIASVNNPKVVATLNATGHVMAAQAAWQGDSGLVVPQPAAVPIRR